MVMNKFEIDTLQSIFEWIECETEPSYTDADFDLILKEYVTRSFMYQSEQNELLQQYGLELVELALDYIKEMGTGLYTDKFVEYALWQVIDNNNDTLKQFYDKMVLQQQKEMN